jgi:hypothetical protein
MAPLRLEYLRFTRLFGTKSRNEAQFPLSPVANREPWSPD